MSGSIRQGGKYRLASGVFCTRAMLIGKPGSALDQKSIGELLGRLAESVRSPIDPLPMEQCVAYLTSQQCRMLRFELGDHVENHLDDLEDQWNH